MILDPAAALQITETRDFSEFLNQTTKIVEKALVVSSKYDIMMDYAKDEETSQK